MWLPLDVAQIANSCSFERHQYMDLKKLWENTEANTEITNVCDVYGAEHLARLIGMCCLSLASLS